MKPLLFAAVLLLACSPSAERDLAAPAAARTSILLVTLDTTRADALGVESGGDATPNLDALSQRGVRFTHAYSTVPTTLPAHASMLTGLHPAEHGVHENARYLSKDRTLLAELLRDQGYATAAFVSGFPLDGRFGLARGFDHYDDDFAPAAERRAGETTDRALAYLERWRPSAATPRTGSPLFLWVHYFDPHDPYDPPEPFRSRFDPYLGEIAYMDSEVGRLLSAFERRFAGGGFRVVVAGDHGEGLGDHGEALHGNLLYQGVMRVPMIVAGSGVEPGVISEPVSIRGIFDAILAWAEGHSPAEGLLAPSGEPVLGEAMKPYLQYGWRPQVMAVHGRIKVIQVGDVEVYDVEVDPAESVNLAGRVQLDPELRRALRAYPSPPPAPENAAELSQADRERLASLGYVGWEGRPAQRDDAPAPKDMTHLFAELDLGSRLFVEERYDQAARVFEAVLDKDPGNLMVCLRLGVAHSVRGRDRRALELFERARKIDPSSIDVRHYLGLHHLSAGRIGDAEPLLESVVAQSPDRLPALEALARIRETQGRFEDAAALIERALDVAPESAAQLTKLGELKMAVGDTPGAISAYERARAIQGERFDRFLELGVCYLADRRPEEAADCLDRVPPGHPGWPMALFKRAQVAVLLGESDRAGRIRSAAENADATTRPLIESEALFRGVAWR